MNEQCSGKTTVTQEFWVTWDLIWYSKTLHASPETLETLRQLPDATILSVTHCSFAPCKLQQPSPQTVDNQPPSGPHLAPSAVALSWELATQCRASSLVRFLDPGCSTVKMAIKNAIVFLNETHLGNSELSWSATVDSEAAVDWTQTATQGDPVAHAWTSNWGT